METQEVEDKIHSAINELFKRDNILLEIDVNERTITHRLAIYLEKIFWKWDVDCEYNRFFDEQKQIIVTKKLLSLGDGITSIANENAKTVFPDIIVHHRNKKENLIAIEVKKTTNKASDEADLKKLHAYKEQLGYAYAVFIRFKTDSKDIGIETFEMI